MSNFTITMSNMADIQDRRPIYEIFDRFVFARPGSWSKPYRAGINVRSYQNSTYGYLKVKGNEWPAAVKAELLVPYANDPGARSKVFKENSEQGFIDLLSELAVHIQKLWIVQAFSVDLRLDGFPGIRAREWRVQPGTREVQVTNILPLPSGH